ncbi:YfbM family protein [Nocardia sp. 2]|uniref:YfbM family protein n=1 Tax=Nocardia acididurans TaxID=2802282 RepID=A0ABS1MAR8_9NOCA|nr:YfbM family protein [Nocardia acididurans]MBL1077376.1 YfbM family protein [Nocardia acididurans]
MGMYLSFTRVSPEELQEVLGLQRDPQQQNDFLMSLDRAGEPGGDLDKAWDGLRYLLEAAGTDIDLLYGIDDDYAEGTPIPWPLVLVSSTAAKLRAISFEQLAAHYDPDRMEEADVYPGIWTDTDFAFDYVREAYESLVEFFEFATARGSGAVSYLG